MSLQLSGNGVVTGLNSVGSSDLGTVLGSKLDLAGGKILQIVRATDSTSRSTTSTSYVDVTGMSVTITPQKNDSAIFIIFTAQAEAESTSTGNRYGLICVTDSSNNAISGATQIETGQYNITGSGTFATVNHVTGIAYATPGTTSATTYKLRFQIVVAGMTLYFRNDKTVGQMYAIEVSA
jgi:hypothetical protein